MTVSMKARIAAASPAGRRRIALTLADGATRVVDVSGLLRGPAFERIAVDDAAFAELYVDDELGTICWPGGIDLAPEVLATLPDA